MEHLKKKFILKKKEYINKISGIVKKKKNSK